MPKLTFTSPEGEDYEVEWSEHERALVDMIANRLIDTHCQCATLPAKPQHATPALPWRASRRFNGVTKRNAAACPPCQTSADTCRTHVLSGKRTDDHAIDEVLIKE